MRYSIIALLSLALVACTAKRQAGDLTVSELLKRGAELNGKRIAVIGYYVAELENSSIYDSPDDWKHHYDEQHLLPDGVFSRHIWVDSGWRDVARLTNRLTHRYVRIIGTFHYRPEFRRTIEKRDDGREFESIDTRGYGHMGLSPAEIANVTFFRPLR
jgi:hypothetical protein